MSGNKNLQSKDKEYSGSDSIDYVASQWQRLPPHIREAIITLVDASMAIAPCNTQAHSQDTTRGEE